MNTHTRPTLSQANLAVSPARRSATVATALALAALMAGAGCNSTADAHTPSTTAQNEPTVPIVNEAELQIELNDLVALGVPGVVLLVRDNDQSIVLTAGVSDLEAQTPMSPDATFRVASLTKPYTASIVMQLVAEGTLQLDDNVEQWLPGIVKDADRITIRDLLGHTSGVADYFDDPAVLQPYYEGDYEHVWTPQQLVEIADHLGASFKPGTDWKYSNTNYAIVGLIIEQATGHTLGEEMQTRIFDELGLVNTTFATDTRLDPQIAHGYLMGDGDPIDTTGIFPVPYGAGNIVSDAADTATFYGALFGGEVVEPALLDEMKQINPKADIPYGLGVMTEELPCGVAYGHDGGYAGYSTRSLVLNDGRQVVLLANSITVDDQVSFAADDQFAAIIESAMCG